MSRKSSILVNLALTGHDLGHLPTSCSTAFDNQFIKHLMSPIKQILNFIEILTSLSDVKI